jgi:predicted deacylase
MATSTIRDPIDYERTGAQFAHLLLPHSPHSDAWGAIAIPIVVIKNGGGPTVLLIGGNHGDEYEGPIAMSRLARELDPGELQGRLIILPALNTPAVLAAQRTSPLDGLNLNRCFPGDAFGSPTQQIVYYLTHVLYPMADLIMDLHSGGSSLEMLPLGIVEPAEDPAQQQRNLDAVLTFDAPFSVIHANPGDPRTSTATAVRLGKTIVGSELGSGGAVSIDGIAVAARGIRNVLVGLGMLEAKHRHPPFERRSRLLHAMGFAAHVYAPEAGVFEPFCHLGAEVEAGDVAGVVHFLDDPARPPVEARFERAGIVFSRRAPGRCVRGSCLAVVGREETV